MKRSASLDIQLESQSQEPVPKRPRHREGTSSIYIASDNAFRDQMQPRGCFVCQGSAHGLIFARLSDEYMHDAERILIEEKDEDKLAQFLNDAHLVISDHAQARLCTEEAIGKLSALIGNVTKTRFWWRVDQRDVRLSIGASSREVKAGDPVVAKGDNIDLIVRRQTNADKTRVVHTVIWDAILLGKDETPAGIRTLQRASWNQHSEATCGFHVPEVDELFESPLFGQLEDALADASRGSRQGRPLDQKKVAVMTGLCRDFKAAMSKSLDTLNGMAEGQRSNGESVETVVHSFKLL